MAHHQSAAELVRQLSNQLSFLKRSTSGYDAGQDAEAVRLATTVRILCHDTDGSQSLLGQLGVKATLRFVDTNWSPPEKRQDAYEESDDADLVMVVLFRSPLARMGGQRGYDAPLGRAVRAEPKLFEEWWEAVVVESPDAQLSRREVVLSLAHKDGGAHVDPKIPEGDYLEVSRRRGLGTLVVNGEEVDMNPTFAVMRQIAYEVEATLADIVGSVAGRPEN